MDRGGKLLTAPSKAAPDRPLRASYSFSVLPNFGGLTVLRSMPRVSRPIAALLFTLAFGATWFGCDTAPGLPDESDRPGLSALSISPTQDSLETSAARTTVPVVVTGTLAGQGTITVRTLVRYAETDTLVAEITSNEAPGTFEQSVPLSLPRGATGEYAISVTTEGPDGRAGDEGSAVFHFKAASLGAPSLTLEVGTTVVRQANRSVTLPIVAVVTDPDGRENIATVIIRFPDGGVIGQLLDEGRTSRSSDAVADDGRYSGGISVTPATPAGSYTLEVLAVDRAGQESAPASFTFAVQ